MRMGRQPKRSRMIFSYTNIRAMSDSRKTPKASLMRRRGLFLCFIALAVAVIVGGSRWQHRHAETIAEPADEVDSTLVRTREAGENFLARKARERGVRSLGGGLLYKVLHAGSGARPTASSTVVVDYEGRLIDGTVFDSSYRRGEPAEFPVSGVIQGWQIALKAMKVGDEWEIYIPEYLAYGEAGSGDRIPPCSALVFKVSLRSVK